MNTHRTISLDAPRAVVLSLYGTKVTRGYFFPRPVKYGNFSGRSDIENCPFHSRSTVSRYGTSKQQHGNGTYGNEDNSTIRGVTERGGQLYSRPITSNQDSAEVTSVPSHFCLAAIDRRRCLLIFQAQSHPNLQ